MILKPGPNAPPHFFLIGVRAPPGQTGPDAERVGTFVARSVLRFDGMPAVAGEVRTEDEPFAVPAGAPPRHEAEIAPWKPAPDVAVVDDLGSFLTPGQIADADHLDEHVVAAGFGSVSVDRGAGFGPAIPRHFGWLPKIKGSRLALAGDAANFDPDVASLPDGFDNAFHNGNPLAGAPFAAGERLRFVDNLGPVTEATVPPAPRLTVSKNGRPLDPPLVLAPLADTVVMDRGTSEFTFVWRATFPWEPRFEGAELEVN